jgi:two-component system, NarL family, response regulator NreC
MAKNTNLTDRERAVVAYVAGGCTVRQAAGILYISPKTAEVHLHNAMSKLGLHNRAQLVRYAIENGLVPPITRRTEAQ